MLQRMTDSTMTEQNTPKEHDLSADTAWPRMTKEQINARPIRKYKGPIHLIQKAQDIEQAVEHLEEETVLGFDTETRPTFRVGQHYLPALLQLAGEKAVYIFQLRQCRLSKALRRVLANPKIVKAGIALDRDVKELNKLAPFEAGRMQESRHPRFGYPVSGIPCVKELPGLKLGPEDLDPCPDRICCNRRLGGARVVS